jgi:hypothetical protein
MAIPSGDEWAGAQGIRGHGDLRLISPGGTINLTILPSPTAAKRNELYGE